MNVQQQDLVIDLAQGKVSREDFLEVFFPESVVPEDYVLHELEAAFEAKDADSVECVLVFAALFSLPKACSGILSRLLGEEWHIRHEEIASALQSLKCPDSVDSLFNAALINHPYICSEYALGVKCIHALRAIGTANAKDKLRLLSQAQNPVLSERAARYLAAMS